MYSKYTWREKRVSIDSLFLSGWAQYNLCIQFCLDIQCIHQEDRATIPSSFLSSPSHLDHSWLYHSNYLAQKTGVGGDVHHNHNICIFPSDNGEQFLSNSFLNQNKEWAMIFYIPILVLWFWYVWWLLSTQVFPVPTPTSPPPFMPFILYPFVPP